MKNSTWEVKLELVRSGKPKATLSTYISAENQTLAWNKAVKMESFCVDELGVESISVIAVDEVMFL